MSLIGPILPFRRSMRTDSLCHRGSNTQTFLGCRWAGAWAKGEAHLIKFDEWFALQSRELRDQLRQRYPEPDSWRGFFQNWEKAR